MSRAPAAGPTGYRRGLRAVVAGGAVSAFGTQMTVLALPWLVLETTGSAARTSLVLLAQVLPIALFGLLGGEVLQRLGARRTMLVSDGTRGVLIAAVPLLYGTGALSFPVLLALVAAAGLAAVPYAASQRLLAGELAGDDQRALTRAHGLIDTVYNSAGFGGPMLAGLLIAVIGAERVLWLDAATFAVSFVVLLGCVPARAGRAAAGGTRPRGVLAGIRHMRADPFLGRTMASTIAGGFVLRFLAICLPLLAFHRYGGDAAVGGLLLAGTGAGMLAGSFLAVLVSRRLGPAPMIAVAMVFQALPLWLLALPAPPVVPLTAVVLSGAAMGFSNAPYFAILTARVPAALQPKVLQAVMTLSTVAGPLGLLAAGVVIDRAGWSRRCSAWPRSSPPRR
ncbi:MFS transporter [Phytohabitans rumicis]|uniref:Putative multidrug-efflux transporter n=1 Tax=Phytohabitans rumicis TaxID=1076125 RepID=A0A6V8LGR7_9ACTN|nr:MFS transporter [Phytohabitans rumicis]GFJ93769.1 putative multidrug-efflux transporter [Phytohabitans rumicis]